MNPLTVALMIMVVFSAIAGVIIAVELVLPQCLSRRDAFVATGVGVATLIGLHCAMLATGPAMQVVVIALGTMVFVCTMGMLLKALFGFRQHCP